MTVTITVNSGCAVEERPTMPKMTISVSETTYERLTALVGGPDAFIEWDEQFVVLAAEKLLTWAINGLFTSAVELTLGKEGPGHGGN